MVGGLQSATAPLGVGAQYTPRATQFKFAGRGCSLSSLARATRETAAAQLSGARGVIARVEATQSK